MSHTFNVIYIAIAVCISLFYGCFAGRIFIIDWKDFKFLQRVYQFIFNLLGGVFGFSALYYLINKVFTTSSTVNIGDSLIFIVAIFGTMGLLPRAMVGLAGKLKIKLP